MISILYLLNNNEYILNQVYYISTHYLKIDNIFFLLIVPITNESSLSDSYKDNSSLPSSILLYDNTDKLLMNTYDTVAKCKFNNYIDWNNLIIPEKKILLYIRLLKDIEISDRFKRKGRIINVYGMGSF